MSENKTLLETKNLPEGFTPAPVGLEMKKAVEEIGQKFTEYKTLNDQRIEEIKKAGFESPETKAALTALETKIAAQEKAYQDLILQVKRPALSGDDGQPLDQKAAEFEIERKSALNHYFVTGDPSRYQNWKQKAVEEKQLSVGSSPDGGFLIKPTVSNRIRDGQIIQVSPIRAIAGIENTTKSAHIVHAYVDDGTGYQWVGEQTTRSETGTPQFKEIEIPVRQIIAKPITTQDFLDDSPIDVESWILRQSEKIFNKQEGLTFISGNGATRPFGFLSKTTVANASYAWGSIGYTATGDSDNFIDVSSTVNPADALISLLYSLKSEYRANAKWLMNSNTLAAVRKFKDTTGQYIWQPSVQAGQPSLLLGYPVVTCEDMPSVGTNTYPVAFGDFMEGYTIVDRRGIYTIKDIYTTPGKVIFNTSKRVGGDVTNYEAIKLLKCATS